MKEVDPQKKILVITGGSSGIGKAIASLLSSTHRVINADIKEQVNLDDVDHFFCDITDSLAINQLYQYVIQHYGIPDVLISNAGQGIHERLGEGDPEKWKKIIDVNLMGALRFVRAFLPDMLKRESGHIIFISSTASTNPYEYGGVYAASKAALDMVAKTMRLEVAGLLKVGLISPGVVNTEFFRNMISGHHTVEDIGWGSLSPHKVAEIVKMIINLPKEVKLPQITILPKNQPF